jgi:hypothetical protein
MVKETKGKGPQKYSSKVRDDRREEGKGRVTSEDDEKGGLLMKKTNREE